MMEILVSVIVPVYNGEKYIKTCLESILSQSLPKNQYEVIVVDNGSTDHSEKIARQYEVRVLRETKRGSYAARNAGINAAKAQIIGFIDVDCIASNNWLECAVRYFIENPGADILSGKVEFFSHDHLNIWGDFDKQTFLNQEYSYKSGVAKTANMFVSSTVFETIGYFNDALQSGGDVDWTAKAVIKGASIHYEPRAVVYHPVRNSFDEMAKKVFRVGTGKGQIFKENNRERRNSNLGVGHLKHPFKLLGDTMKTKDKKQPFLYPLYMTFAISILSSIFVCGMLKGLFIKNA